MMLYVAMIDLLRPGDDVRAVTESLKVYVANAPSLITIIENRLKPSPNDEQMRQMAEEDARRKRKSEREQTKARASWGKSGRRSQTSRMSCSMIPAPRTQRGISGRPWNARAPKAEPLAGTACVYRKLKSEHIGGEARRE
jgi:hypothetical protein